MKLVAPPTNAAIFADVAGRRCSLQVSRDTKDKRITVVKLSHVRAARERAKGGALDI